MDNPLIYTVNKNLEMAMAKYSSITGQLAEMKKKILGTENEKIMIRAANVEETISREHSDEKKSLLSTSSSEAIESDQGRKNITISGENIASELTETSTDSMKSDSMSEEKENIFNELYKNLNEKSKHAINTKFDPSDTESDDEAKSSGSCSDNDHTIENLFMEEISKADLDENTHESDHIEKRTEEIEGKCNNLNKVECDEVDVRSKLKRFDSSKSSSGDIQIPYENIFSSEPLNIVTILEEDENMGGLIKESKKNKGASVNLSDKKFLELYGNDDTLSVRTRCSVLKGKKNSAGKRISSAKQNSYESNMNSLISEIKSQKPKSIKSEGKKKQMLRNGVKLKEKKKEIQLINRKDNLNKDSQFKRNEKNKLHQLALLKGIPLQRTKSKSTIGKKMKEISVNNIQPKYNQKSLLKENRFNEKKYKTNKSLDKLTNEKIRINSKETKNIPNLPITSNLKKKQLKLPPKTPAKSYPQTRRISKINISDDQEENSADQAKTQKEISLSNPKDILTKLEEQILSVKLKEVQNAICEEPKQIVTPLELNKKKLVEKVPEKIILKEANNNSKNKNKAENCNVHKLHKLSDKYITNRKKINKKEDILLSKNISKIESLGELQKDGINTNKFVKKSSLITNIASKNNLINEEKYQLVNKNSYITESIGEVHNEILNMNIDDKKTLNFPFILGRSASKSFNIQANIQQITSLVRMLPKDTIQRTLLDENDAVSRASTKVTEMKCPACEKGCDASDINSTDDPWDNTSKNFIRCTCMSKNTISSKYVLQQLLMQSNFSPMLPPYEANISQFEEFPDRHIFNQESSNMNLYKRHDLTKLLHATQRFVTNKLVG